MKLSRDRYIVEGMIVWIDANTTYIQRGNLLISQRLPLKPSKQLHEQLLTASKHEPLLKHGWLAQSSISVKGIQKSKLQCPAQTVVVHLHSNLSSRNNHNYVLRFGAGVTSPVVLLDMSKVFDSVNHDILLKKLQHIGLSPSAILWFKSYLSNRY